MREIVINFLLNLNDLMRPNDIDNDIEWDQDFKLN